VGKALAALLFALGPMLASGARAANAPAPLPVATTAVDPPVCPPLPPQPTEAELVAARLCVIAIAPSAPAPGGGGGGGSAGPAGPGSPGTPPPQPGPAGKLQGPYVVKQTQSLHRESISGSACDEAQPFDVHFVTRPATFDTRFAPAATPGQPGKWSYAYGIPRAGESHAAQGTYTLQADLAARALHVTMTGSDRVIFNGFNGDMPIDYQFDLVATPGAPCSPVP
jgi:hypothetical protein